MITLNARLLLALLMVLVLTILPLPTFIANFRPPWVLLLVLYVQFFLPSYFRVTGVFFLGLCLDVLLSTVIGEHAFALLLTSWLAADKTRRFNFFSTIQQMLLLSLFCLVYQFMIYLLDASLGYNYGIISALEAALFGMLFWPWLKLLADHTLFYKYQTE
ncbi:rod shape-determining protein MreD [bacterium]|nr:rod shape-determining protein MreD [bacterium]